MSNHNTGGTGYADDLILLTLKRSGLKVLFEICKQYANEYCVKFNTGSAKSMFLVFRGRNCKLDNSTVVLNGTELQRVQDAVHLGHHVATINKDRFVADGIAKFWRGHNMFIGDFGHINTAVNCKLFKQHCCSYYGAPLWDVQSKSVGNMTQGTLKVVGAGITYTRRCCLVVV